MIPEEGAVVDLSASKLPGDLAAVIDLGAEGLRTAEQAAKQGARLPLADVRLLAPFPRPRAT